MISWDETHWPVASGSHSSFPTALVHLTRTKRIALLQHEAVVGVLVSFTCVHCRHLTGWTIEQNICFVIKLCLEAFFFSVFHFYSQFFCKTAYFLKMNYFSCLLKCADKTGSTSKVNWCFKEALILYFDHFYARKQPHKMSLIYHEKMTWGKKFLLRAWNVYICFQALHM